MIILIYLIVFCEFGCFYVFNSLMFKLMRQGTQKCLVKIVPGFFQETKTKSKFANIFFLKWYTFMYGFKDLVFIDEYHD